MLTIKPIDRESDDYPEFKRLYHASFPKSEQVPLDDLLGHHKDTELEAYYDDENHFVGFYGALREGDILCILYFSVEESMRDHGYGSMILENIKKNHPGYRIIVDTEEFDPDAPNEPQRISRRHFYEANGFAVTDICQIWKGNAYRIMVYGGTITESEYDDLFLKLDPKRKKDLF